MLSKKVSIASVAIVAVMVLIPAAAAFAAGAEMPVIEPVVEVGVEIFSRPAITETSIILGTADGRVLCYEKSSGKKIWEASNLVRVDGAPAVDSERVFVTSAANAVTCLDLKTGRQIWQVQHPGCGYTTPILSANVVLIAGKGSAVALYRGDGKTAARFPFEGEGKSLAVSGGDLIVEINRDIEDNNYVGRGSVAYFDLVDKKQRWETRLQGADMGAIALVGMHVVVGDRSGRVSALGIMSGSVEWSLDCHTLTKSSARSNLWADCSIAIAKNRILLCASHQEMNESGILACVDSANGKVAWSIEHVGGSLEVCEVAAAHGIVFAAAQDRVVIAADIETGRFVNIKDLEHDDKRGEFASIVIDGDEAWLNGADGILYRLDVARVRKNLDTNEPPRPRTP